MENSKPDPAILKAIVKTTMPFGKYKGIILSELPVFYLEWFHGKGFPPGKLGMMLSTVYEIKINGLTGILNLVKQMPK